MANDVSWQPPADTFPDNGNDFISANDLENVSLNDIDGKLYYVKNSEFYVYTLQSYHRMFAAGMQTNLHILLNVFSCYVVFLKCSR